MKDAHEFLAVMDGMVFDDSAVELKSEIKEVIQENIFKRLRWFYENAWKVAKGEAKPPEALLTDAYRKIESVDGKAHWLFECHTNLMNDQWHKHKAKCLKYGHEEEAAKESVKLAVLRQITSRYEEYVKDRNYKWRQSNE